MEKHSTPTIIGEHLFAKDSQGRLVSRVGTVFPHVRSVVTLPGIHATQRIAFIEMLNREHEEQGQPPLSDYEQNLHWENSVDLVIEEDRVLIRPDPSKMALAFEADELLQEIVPKHKIHFMHVINDQVRKAIKRRGEYWRISPLPRGVDEIKKMIEASRIGIGGEDIYYYNRATGTRVLTCGQFEKLKVFDEAQLRVHLSEIQDFSGRRNRHGQPEITFFKAGPGFSADQFAAYDFYSLTSEELVAAHAQLYQRFCQSVPPEFRKDDPDSPDWRREMFASLIGREEQVIPEEIHLGMSSEFYMQVEWLPGGRIEDGELIFDSIFEQAEVDPSLARICDNKVKGIIFNFIREYGDLLYVNIGRVSQSLSKRRSATGRRDVYIAEIMLKGEDRELVRIIRMVKWGIREHLKEGKSLLESIIEAEEYIEYILDRRLGCRQLGMNLPSRIVARNIAEDYPQLQDVLRGRPIWVTYIERDYISGIATDKMPPGKFVDAEFCRRFASLLGTAAARNIVVGRSDLDGNVVFDDGDEVIRLNAEGLPEELLVSDPTGTFNDYRTPMVDMANAYAPAVNTRTPYIGDAMGFATTYIEAFGIELARIQSEYRMRQRGFDTLFRHRRCDPNGSYAYRWIKVLERLNNTDTREVVHALSNHIHVKGTNP